jgi:hypothetical protein
MKENTTKLLQFLNTGIENNSGYSIPGCCVWDGIECYSVSCYRRTVCSVVNVKVNTGSVTVVITGATAY